MKTLIIYHSSHHGNTAKVADAIADELNADALTTNEVATEKLADYDLIGFGSGIYFFKHHASLLKLVETLPPLKKDVFIFSTRGGGSAKSAHKTLKNRLLEKDCNVIGEFSCKGWDTYSIAKLFGGVNKNHPDADDLEDAREFAQSLKSTENEEKD